MKQPSNLGADIGFVLWGLCLLGLPKFTGMPPAVAWICYVLGFVSLLIGIMGTCIEVGKRYPGGRNDE